MLLFSIKKDLQDELESQITRRGTEKQKYEQTLDELE